MKRRQIGVCAAACAIAACASLVSFAQQQPAAGPDARQPRPAAPVLRVAPLDPQMEQLLKVWERESARIKTLSGRHTRFEYNTVFQTEKRSAGRFFFEAPDKGRIDLTGVKLKVGEQSNRLNDKNEPFRLLPGDEERWVCTGAEILQINDQEKNFEIINLPPELQGTNIVRSPLPFLFGLKAEEAKKRFTFKLVKETSDSYMLDVVPLTGLDAFRLAQVRLDKKLFIPTAVKLFDLSGGIETLYLFTDLKVNEPGFQAWVKGILGGDPFKPKLAGYTRVQSIQPVVDQTPDGQKVPIHPAVQKQPGAPPATPQRTATTPAPRPGTTPTKTAINR